jgi:hypothetical protein
MIASALRLFIAGPELVSSFHEQTDTKATGADKTLRHSEVKETHGHLFGFAQLFAGARAIPSIVVSTIRDHCIER